MVWGAISLSYYTDLIIISRNMIAVLYMDQVLEPHDKPFVKAHHDLNARPHAAYLIRELLAEKEIQVMLWTPSITDINPVEHLWDVLGRHVVLSEPCKSTVFPVPGAASGSDTQTHYNWDSLAMPVVHAICHLHNTCFHNQHFKLICSPNNHKILQASISLRCDIK